MKVLAFEKNVKIEKHRSKTLKNWVQTHIQNINENFLKCQNQEWSVHKEERFNTTFLFIQVTKLKTLIWYCGPWYYLNITIDAQVWFKRLTSTTSFNIFKCKNFAIAYLLGSDVHQN
jgi:hypothetical protein